jgi:hypothetical protein
MKKSCICLLSMLIGIFGLAGCAEKPNTLDNTEVEAGWQLLFDGKSLSGWRGYMNSDLTNTWSVQDGVIALKAGNPHGSYIDLISEQSFNDFELAWKWKIEAGSNTGLMFHVKEGPKFPYLTGPEYQLLDNKGFQNGKGESEQPKGYTASHYAIEEAYEEASNPIGEWNSSRIKVEGNNVEYWLNDVKTANYIMHSDKWNKQVAAAKFGNWPLFGTTGEGHIVLQDHGHAAWFRSIKIRNL